MSQAFNPYAPPGAPQAPAPATAGPLPEGVRRYGITREGVRELLARQTRAVWIGFAVACPIYCGVLFANPYRPSITVSASTYLVVIVGILVLRRWNLRRLEPQIAAQFEILVSPRAIRRAAYRIAVAEIVQPDVRRIVEVPQGLALLGEARVLWIARQTTDYAELRDRMAAWGRIEQVTGAIASYRIRRKLMLGPRLSAYDLGRDAVTHEASLREELATLRTVGLPEGARVVRRNSRAWVVLALWIVLILLFLAIWQFLSPPERHARPRRSPPNVEEPAQ